MHKQHLKFRVLCEFSNTNNFVKSQALSRVWAALVMGIVSGTGPWFTMMSLSRKLSFLQKIDDTLGVFHTHAVAGTLGGALTGLFAHPSLSNLFLPIPNSEGAFYGSKGGVQFLKQLVGASFIIGWNVLVTSIILLVIRLLIPLRMSEEDLKIGDDAAHGEEAYALIGQGQREKSTNNIEMQHMARQML